VCQGRVALISVSFLSFFAPFSLKNEITAGAESIVSIVLQNKIKIKWSVKRRGSLNALNPQRFYKEVYTVFEMLV